VINEVVSVAEPVPVREPEKSPGRLSARRVMQIAAGLIALQLALRTWVASNSFLWQDDFIITGRAAKAPLLSAEFLLADHDGHFLPAGYLITGVFTRLWPFEWWPMAVTLVLMQALASLAVWRLLRLLLGDRPIILAPLMLCLFSPLTLPSFTWWITGLNALPLQAGLAWVAGDAIRLMRTGRPRYAVTGTIAFALALASFEKSLVVPIVAFAVVVLLCREAGNSTPFASAARHGRWLWAGMLVVVAAWALAYSTAVGSPVIEDNRAGSVPQAVGLVENGILRGFLPGLLGGPLSWDQTVLYAAPATALVVAGCVAAVLAVVWTSRWRRGSGVVWWSVAAYVGVGLVAVIAGRLSAMTSDLLALSLRYFADSVLVVAIAIALIARLPVRTDRRPRFTVPVGARRLLAAGSAAVFLTACVWSTVTYTGVWSKVSTEDYLATASTSLAEASDVPFFDHPVPPEIIWGLAAPFNAVSSVFAPLEDRPEFGRATTDLRVLDDTGRLIDARVTPSRWLADGPLTNCGHAVAGERTTIVPLDGPLIPWDWTLQLNYLAGDDGVLEVSLDGEAVRTPVQQGANTVYVRVAGGGDAVRLRSTSPGVGICLDSGVVGNVEPVS
jgi:hypothetical protein